MRQKYPEALNVEVEGFQERVQTRDQKVVVQDWDGEKIRLRRQVYIEITSVREDKRREYYKIYSEIKELYIRRNHIVGTR